jgi:hypothetical protein
MFAIEYMPGFLETAVSAVEAESALFQAKIKRVRMHATESRESGGVSPEALDPVDVVVLYTAWTEQLSSTSTGLRRG